MAILEIIKYRFGKAEFRDAVAQDASNFVLAFKNCNIIAAPCQNHCNCQSCRTGSYNRNLHAVGDSWSLGHLIGIGSGNIAFNSRKMDRSTLFSKNTVALTLVLMVADKAADSSQRVIFKKNPSCFVQLVIFLKPDYLRNRGANGAAFLTLWNFTAQTAV